MMTQETRFIPCAVIGAPFGVRGAAHVYPSSGQCDHLLSLTRLYRLIDGQYQPFTITAIRQHQDHLVISFSEITSPEQVKTYVHQQLYVDRALLPALDADRYYWFQLQGLQVLTLEGTDLGIVTELYSNGPQDIMLTSQGQHIPFIRDTFVKSVDLEAKKIIVDFNPVYEEA